MDGVRGLMGFADGRRSRIDGVGVGPGPVEVNVGVGEVDGGRGQTAVA